MRGFDYETLSPSERAAIERMAPLPPVVFITLSKSESQAFVERWRSRLAASRRAEP